MDHVPTQPHATHDWLAQGGPFATPALPPDPEKAVMEAMSAASTPLRAYGVAQVELMTLVSRRAQAYLGLPHRLSRCRTQQDVIDAQVAFWKTAMQQYQDSSARLLGAWSHMFQPPVADPASQPVQPAAELIRIPQARTSHDAPRRVRETA